MTNTDGNKNAFTRLIGVFVLLIIFLLTTLPVNAMGDEYVIGTWNLEWFYNADSSDDEFAISDPIAPPNNQEYQDRVKTIANAIAEIHPTILALQEVENEEVVQDLAEKLFSEHSLEYEVAFVKGRDTFTGQDVAYLVEKGIPLSASRFDFSPFDDDDDFKDLSKHLKLNTTLNGESFALINVHLITRQQPRLKQANTLRAWISPSVATGHLVVLGDFNTGQRFNQTSPDGDMGIIRGLSTSDQDDDLFDAHQLLGQRATHVSGRELDRVLVSPSLQDNDGLELMSIETRRDLAIIGTEDRGRGVDYSKSISEQDLSDHFPLVATFKVTN